MSVHVDFVFLTSNMKGDNEGEKKEPKFVYFWRKRLEAELQQLYTVMLTGLKKFLKTSFTP